MRSLAVSLVLVALVPASVALAQRPQQPGAPEQGSAPAAEVSGGDGGDTFRSVFADVGRALVRTPSRHTLITLGVGGALALAAHPADRTLTEQAAQSAPLDVAFEPGEVVGDGWVQGGAALATFVVGRATGNPRVRSLGADLVKAQLVGAVLTHGLKFAAGRTRPDGGAHSFPSGHTSSTFASAAVLQQHFGWDVGVPAYAIAAYVAASRLPENRHYASDVVFGAAIGLVAGRSVTVGHGRAVFAMAPVAVPGGAGVAFTRVP